MNKFSNTSCQCYFDNAATTRVRDEVADKMIDDAMKMEEIIKSD